MGLPPDALGLLAQQQDKNPMAQLAQMPATPEQQIQQGVQQPGRFKQMLMGALWGASRGAFAAAGIESPEETQYKQGMLGIQQQQANSLDAERQAQTQYRQFQMEQQKSMVTLPNGMQVPFALAKTAFPQLLRNEGNLDVADANNKAKASNLDKTLNSKESIASTANATKLAAENIKGSYAIRRAAIMAQSGGGGSAADYLPALAQGLPINLVPSKLRGQALALAKMNNVPVSFQKMSQGGQKMVDSISELQPVLANARAALESHKTENDLGSYVKGLGEGAKYKMGIATDDPLYQQINKVGNLVKVLGATPYTTVGRGKYLFDEIQKHLPRPGLDTPQLMYEKINTLDGLLQQMEEAVNAQQFKGPMGMSNSGGATASPGGPKVGQVVDGYTFLGGNPADKNSWKK